MNYISLGLMILSITLYVIKSSKNKMYLLFFIIIIIIYTSLQALYFACDYFTGEGINRQAIYTITDSLTGVEIDQYIFPTSIFAVFILFIITLSTVLLNKIKKPEAPFIYTLLSLVIAIASIFFTTASQQLCSLLYGQLISKHSDFQTYYKNASRIIPSPKLNVIYIYGESLERTFFDGNIFPNLTPDMNDIKVQALDFSSTQQLKGTDFTIGGIVASQCGLPLFTPFNHNANKLSSFFPDITCLGDILKKSGYENYFYQGADLRFSSKDIFLKTHGIDNAYGYRELKNKITDIDYKNDWGLYDDTILDFAWQKYVELSQDNKRFAIFALTVDTHPPMGFISNNCKRKSYLFQGREDSSLSAVSCSQQHIAEFINKVRQSPWFKDTIIIVSSDHLSMQNTISDELLKHERQNLFLVIRGDKVVSGINSTPRSTLDNGATLLDILGGSQELGLGRSSVSTESLSEIFPNLDTKVLEWESAIIKLWDIGEVITDFVVDIEKGNFIYSGKKFPLPVLLRINEESKLDMPFLDIDRDTLRYNLSHFRPTDRYLWVDQCYYMARLGNGEWDKSNQLCAAQGTLDSDADIQLIDKSLWHSKVTINSRKRNPDNQRYKDTIRNLKRSAQDIRYVSDTILFNVQGYPTQIKSVEGLSYPEKWGAWSNAVRNKNVTITYNAPLPQKFDLVITAKASPQNIGQPIAVHIGESMQPLILGAEPASVTLHFNNPLRVNKIMITPPKYDIEKITETFVYTTAKTTPRQLGIGLSTLEVISRE
ncbi:phosphatidylglycerol--membrane-oligosaccharide glycerophosphotransferase [Scandinavium lactucae]|uniref:Phosphatidylglycerol--membrane-oligosaccharide glycerophosphotransferase n=1 Tax=Scandinavium lactucae TaxID=3095028 RepID=A0AAJ2S9S9_9ENTR|nr:MULTISPECIES: phosphatidylglycerol--membrane-oligosaccharide glycerophosphotransferase [unclassified Scandinavium]MDX6032669.1 phosphatidylglycerol--membrane-oligosaccharide glycerophosphotransferase [Scandinavium sp. V105_12]